MCVQSSLYHQQWSDTWRSRFEQKTDSVLFALLIPETKSMKILESLDFSVPRRARYVHIAWKKHQDAVFWVDVNLSIREGLPFYQTRSNAIIFRGTLPAYSIPKVERLKTGEVLYEGVEESYPTPHIHEQMTTSNYGYDNIMLEPNAMNNIDTVAHMNMHYTQY